MFQDIIVSLSEKGYGIDDEVLNLELNKENFIETFSDLIAINILSKNFARESSFGKFIADYMQFMFGKRSYLEGFSRYNAEKCSEDILGPGTCSQSMFRNGKCQGKYRNDKIYLSYIKIPFIKRY